MPSKYLRERILLITLMMMAVLMHTIPNTTAVPSNRVTSCKGLNQTGFSTSGFS